MYLMPQNCTHKNGQNDKFYVLCCTTIKNGQRNQRKNNTYAKMLPMLKAKNKNNSLNVI